MPQHDKSDSTPGNPAPPPLPPAPAKHDPVAAAEEHLANLDMKAQREALKRLSRTL
jgi:hypothetical protein